MAKRYILIVSEGCAGCEEAKKLLADDNRVEVLDVTKSLYAADIIKHAGEQTGTYKVPILVEVDQKQDSVCVLEHDARIACMKESELTRDS